MLRRAIALLALVAPPALFAVAQGCSSEKQPQDMCRWLGDANNCYRRFAADVGLQCGYAPQLGTDPLSSFTGAFLDRTDLTQCIKAQAFGSGLITFDPPLDPTTFPLTSVGFTVLDRKGVLCAEGSMSGTNAYSVTIQPVSAADAGASGPITDDITGGAFSISVPEGRNQLAVSCPGGLETFTFNTLVLQGCAELEPFVPTAILDSSPGIPPQVDGAQGTPGFVRLRILYPPDDPNVDGAVPSVVEYFNCSIPAPPHPCNDGMINGDETDQDCGGSCATKCGEGQNCNTNADCASNNCAPTGGIDACQP
jgi:hypothetical protein